MFKNINFLEFVDDIKNAWYEDRFAVYKNLSTSIKVDLPETINGWGEVVGIDFIKTDNVKPFTILCNNCGCDDCILIINCTQDYDCKFDRHYEILDDVDIKCPECGNFLINR